MPGIKEHVIKFLEKYSEVARRKNFYTLRKFGLYLKSRNLSINEVAASDIEDYILEQRQKGLADSTIRKEIMLLRAFFDYLMERGIVKSNPARKIKAPREKEGAPKYLTRKEVRRMLEVSREYSKRDHAIIALLYFGALREGELARIMEVDWENMKIRILSEKTDEEQLITMNKPLAEALKDVDLNEITSLHPNTIRKIVKKYAKLAGIKKRVYPHILRHSHATHSLKMGVDIRTVQKALRHKSIRSTMRYLHVIDEDIKEAVRKLEF